MTSSFHVLINKNSGTVLKMGEENLQQMIAESALPLAGLHFLSGDEMTDYITRHRDGPAQLLIGGGDGTINHCARHFIGRDNAAMGILPLGTMNLLARDLEVPLDLEEALRGYAQGADKMTIDVGMVNNHSFLCCFGLGTMPESSDFREKGRESGDPLLIPRLTVYVLGKMDRLQHRTFTMRVDGRSHRLKTAALVISNNKFDPDSSGQTNQFKRASLAENILGIYSAAPKTHWEKLRLLLRLGTGGWHQEPSIREWHGQHVVLSGSRKEELISLDGETLTLPTPLTLSIQPQSLNILVPRAGQVTE